MGKFIVCMRCLKGRAVIKYSTHETPRKERMYMGMYLNSKASHEM